MRIKYSGVRMKFLGRKGDSVGFSLKTIFAETQQDAWKIFEDCTFGYQ